MSSHVSDCSQLYQEYSFGTEHSALPLEADLNSVVYSPNRKWQETSFLISFGNSCAGRGVQSISHSLPV